MDVGVVAHARPVVSPECVARSDCLHELQASVHGSSGDLFVGYRDIAAATGARKRL
jgi:hypothetical protein